MMATFRTLPEAMSRLLLLIAYMRDDHVERGCVSEALRQSGEVADAIAALAHSGVNEWWATTHIKEAFVDASR